MSDSRSPEQILNERFPELSGVIPDVCEVLNRLRVAYHNQQSFCTTVARSDLEYFSACRGGGPIVAESLLIGFVQQVLSASERLLV